MPWFRNNAEAQQGPLLIGLCMNFCLLGIMIAQTYFYFRNYGRDKLWIKIFVAVVAFIETLNSALSLVMEYDTLILRFGDEASLPATTWSSEALTMLAGMVECAVQMFYAWRVQRLVRRWWITLPIVVCALLNLAGSLSTAVGVRKFPIDEFDKIKPYVLVWLSGAAAADVLITTALVWHLKAHKSGIQASDKMIDRIMRFTIQAGSLTAVFALIDTILFVADPTAMHLLFNWMLSKLYSNSLISSLNARDAWKRGDRRDDYTTASGSGFGRSFFQSSSEGTVQSGGRRVRDQPKIFVQVNSDVESHELRDAATLVNGRRELEEDVKFPQAKSSFIDSQV